MVKNKKKKHKFAFKVFEYAKYNLIDINDYTIEELIKENTGMSKALLFEKTNSKEAFKKAMNEIFKKELTKEEKEYIAIILKYSNKIREIMREERKEYIEKLKEGVKEDMKFEKYFIEWLEEKEMEGRSEGIKQMIKEMIKNNISDEQIMKIAKIDEKELEKLKIA